MAKGEKVLCATGVCSPVLQPEARWGDIWGMGWLNFHAKLVWEVKRADDKEVRAEMLSLLRCQQQCSLHVIGPRG